MFKTVSAYSDVTLKIVLTVDFLTRGVLIILLNMSLSEYFSWLDLITIGKYSDFSVDWYKKVGYKFVYLMSFCIWTPLIETSIDWFIKLY